MKRFLLKVFFATIFALLVAVSVIALRTSRMDEEGAFIDKTLKPTDFGLSFGACQVMLDEIAPSASPAR